MSKRKTKVMFITISAGIFPTYELALKEANNIKSWLIYKCKTKGYSCKCIIGISKHNPNVGSIVRKKGRPTTFVRRSSTYLTSSKPSEVDSHIHMILFCNPASTIVDMLKNHLNMKYGKTVCWIQDCTDYTENAVNYVFKQSSNIRKVDYDNENILIDDEYGFCECVDMFSDGLVSFRKSKVTPEVKNIENTNVSDNLIREKELLCNNKYNITTYIKDSINKIYKLYILLKDKIERYINNVFTLYICLINKNVPP